MTAHSATLGRLVTTVAGAALACSTTVLAHDGDHHAASDPLGPVVLFVAGIVVLGTSVSLDATDAVDRRYADAGVAFGVLAVLASIALYWL